MFGIIDMYNKLVRQFEWLLGHRGLNLFALSIYTFNFMPTDSVTIPLKAENGLLFFKCAVSFISSWRPKFMVLFLKIVELLGDGASGGSGLLVVVFDVL